MSCVALTECRLCAATLPEKPAVDFGRSPLANSLPREPGPQPTYPLALTQCPVCRHVQLTHAVDPALLYPADYVYEAGLSSVFRAHLAELARTVSVLLPKGARILEIGSNDGTLLKEFRALGHDVIGIDPAKHLAAAACMDGIPTYANPWNLETARMMLRAIERVGERRPSCIVATNVMAHTQSPREFVAGIAELLPDDGLFVFENGYWPAIEETNAFPAVYAEHLDQYTLLPLTHFFDRYGLSLYDAERVDAQGGSIRGYVRKGDREWSDRLKSLIATETVDLPAFAIRALDVSIRLHDLLKEHSWFGIYGAPARLATLCAVTSIDRDAAFVVDDSPTKIGRFTANGAHEIKPPSYLYERDPESMLIAAWPYEADIRARHAEYKGKWIIPFPEVRVV